MGHFNEQGLYELEDIAFVNTSLFNEASRYYRKHELYTHAPKGSKEYDEHWDIEEDRLINGMSAPGKLITVEETKIIDNHPRVFKHEKIQEVHITGEHYGFLNYARIKRTKNQDIAELKNFVTGGGILTKNAKRVGKKDLDFPNFIDGQYHWFKAKEDARKVGLHIVMAKARRKGFSYMEGWDAAYTVNMNPFVTVLICAFDYKYITVGDQMMPMAKSYLDFLELNTDFNRGYLKENVEHIKLGYKLRETGNIEHGFRSQLLALSFMNNPDSAVGKDGYKVKMEECGKWPNLKQSLDVTLPTMKDGSIMTGQMIMFGTGGTDDANWADFEQIYYNPQSYDCMLFNNVWDENSRGHGVGFFYPQQIGDTAFMDEHGNSLQEAALAHGDIDRIEKKKTKTNAEYIKFIAQEARTPKEAFSSGSDNIFPTAEINDQLKKVEHQDDYKYVHKAGRIVRTDKGLIFKENSDLIHEGLSRSEVHDPIFNFPLKDGQDTSGCYVEWIKPYRDPATGKIPKGLYRLWHDPYAHDKTKDKISIRDSLGVTYVYEMPNDFTPGRGDYFIGSYVGRPPRMDDYNEQLLNIVEYVNGILFFENDRGDVKGYFAKNKKLNLLADEPDLEFEASLKGKTGRGKGMHVNDKRKPTGAIYLRDWLLEKRGKDIYGNDKLNLHYIYDVGLLRELLKWNHKGNFDRVSALIVGMFDMKECLTKPPPRKPKAEDKTRFFNRVHYK